MTSKGQITVPAPIRRRLGLKTGQVLEIDENRIFPRATPVFDDQAMRNLVGSTAESVTMTSDEWLDETRGPVDEEP